MIFVICFVLGCYISYRLGREAGIDFYCDHNWVESRSGMMYHCSKCHRTRMVL